MVSANEARKLTRETLKEEKVNNAMIDVYAGIVNEANKGNTKFLYSFNDDIIKDTIVYLLFSQGYNLLIINKGRELEITWN